MKKSVQMAKAMMKKRVKGEQRFELASLDDYKTFFREFDHLMDVIWEERGLNK